MKLVVNASFALGRYVEGVAHSGAVDHLVSVVGTLAPQERTTLRLLPPVHICLKGTAAATAPSSSSSEVGEA